MDASKGGEGSLAEMPILIMEGQDHPILARRLDIRRKWALRPLT